MSVESLRALILAATACWVAWAWVCVWNVRRYIRQYEADRDLEKRHGGRAPYAPPVTVLAAVRGVHEHYREHLDRLTAQDYPDYRICFALESAQDPAWGFLMDFFGLTREPAHAEPPVSAGRAALRPATAPGLRAISVVIAGRADSQGQKVQNLLAAVASLDGQTSVLAFADADSLWEPATLRRLVRPLADPGVGQTTGYRWQVPQDDHPASIVASVVNASVATLLGPSWRTSGWAGAMAMRREVFERLRVAELWRGKVTDGVPLSRHLRSHGYSIRFVPGVTPVELVRYTWRELFAFGRRQYSHGWIFYPKLWWGGAAVTISSLGGWLCCLVVAALGAPRTALACGALVVLADVLRGLARRRAARTVLPAWAFRKLGPVWLWELALTPVWMSVHAGVVFSAVGARHMVWSGTRYRVTRDSTVRLSRG